MMKKIILSMLLITGLSNSMKANFIAQYPHISAQVTWTAVCLYGLHSSVPGYWQFRKDIDAGKKNAAWNFTMDINAPRIAVSLGAFVLGTALIGLSAYNSN